MAKRPKLVPAAPPLNSDTIQLAKERAAIKAASFTHTILRRYVCLYLTVHSGITHNEIASHLRDSYGIETTPQQVAADLQYWRTEWLKTANLDKDKLVEREVEDLERAREMVTMLHAAGETKDAIELTLKIQKRRSNLLGLDKPKKIEIGVKPIRAMTDEEIDKEIAARRLELEEVGVVIDAEGQPN